MDRACQVQCRFRRQGFFKKNGIEAELIFVRGALTLVAALTSGDMNIGYTGGIAVLVIGMDNQPFPSLDGLRNIRRPTKIRNPKLGNAKVEDPIDDQILRRLDESGYTDKLFAACCAK